MLIHCPNCAASYDIKASALGGEGRSVRCTRCQNVWFASAREPALETAGAAAEAMPQASEETGDPSGAGDESEFGAEASAEQFDAVAEETAGDASDTPVGEYRPPSEQSDNPDLIDGAPPLAPDGDFDQRFAPGEGPFPMTGGDIETFVRRKQTKRAKKKFSLPAMPTFKWPLAPMPTLLLGLTATVTLLIGWRVDVVRLLPQTASFYSAIGLGVNLRGVVFENIKTSREIHEGVPVMVVEGEIVSVSRKPVEVPRLRFGVRNGLGAEIYNWTAMPSRTKAEPGERLSFRSRLASPPLEMHDISVRFYNRRDARAGLR